MKIELFKTRKQLFLRVPTFKVRWYFRILGDNGRSSPSPRATRSGTTPSRC